MALSDAITSSAYTGERAIHSSDFSAFTKRSHCPSLLRFSGPITAYSDAIHPFALRRLPTVELCSPRGEEPWNIAVVNRRVRDSSLAMTRTDKYNYMFGVYACGLWDLNVILWESPSHNPPLSAWGVWKGVIHFLSPSRSGGLRGFVWIRGLSWIRDLGFGCLARGDGEWADRPRLSLPPSPEHVCAMNSRLNSRRIICFLARGHVIPFPSR